MIRNFGQLFEMVRRQPRRRLVIPSAEGRSILSACAEARAEGIADSILIGDGAKIRGLVRELELPSDAFTIIHQPEPEAAVWEAVEMVRNGGADMVMKGKTDTPTLLKAILDGERGLRTGRVLSHVAVVEVATYDRLMLTSDGGLNIHPDLEKRMDIVRNAVEMANRLGISRPNVALLSAMEKVNPKMEETLDYEQMLKIQATNPFVDAVMEGPIAMDIALSAESARIKEVPSTIAGAVDVFISPDIAACNMMVKALIYLAGAKASGLVLGASAPVVLLSRSDDAATKLRSIALGALWGR